MTMVPSRMKSNIFKKITDNSLQYYINLSALFLHPECENTVSKYRCLCQGIIVTSKSPPDLHGIYQ